jgi:hypothetical protein
MRRTDVLAVAATLAGALPVLSALSFSMMLLRHILACAYLPMQ